jgi:hypothetical protein
MVFWRWHMAHVRIWSLSGCAGRPRICPRLTVKRTSTFYAADLRRTAIADSHQRRKRIGGLTADENRKWLSRAMAWRELARRRLARHSHSTDVEAA